MIGSALILRRKPRLRFLVAILCAALLPLFVEHAIEPHLAYNHTSSMPRGFYWRTAVPLAGPRRGDIVIACAPTAFARFGQTNGFLDVGRCDGVTSLLKRVIAVAGDRVHLDARGVWVNGVFVPGSRPARISGRKAALPHVAYGDYRLSARDVWLGSAQAKSFDSRYFGPVSNVLAIARPLLVEGSEISTDAP